MTGLADSARSAYSSVLYSDYIVRMFEMAIGRSAWKRSFEIEYGAIIGTEIFVCSTNTLAVNEVQVARAVNGDATLRAKVLLLARVRRKSSGEQLNVTDTFL